eukprot:753776-Hanusia_phi.AAC.11
MTGVDIANVCNKFQDSACEVSKGDKSSCKGWAVGQNPAVRLWRRYLSKRSRSPATYLCEVVAGVHRGGKGETRSGASRKEVFRKEACMTCGEEEEGRGEEAEAQHAREHEGHGRAGGEDWRLGWVEWIPGWSSLGFFSVDRKG